MSAPNVKDQVREAMYQAGIKTTDGRTARQMTDAEVDAALDAFLAHMQSMTAALQQIAGAFTEAARRMGAVLDGHPSILRVAIDLDRERTPV